MSGPDASKSIQTWTDEIHAMAKEKGWWENPRSPLDVHMLIVSEIAEATEEARKKTNPVYFDDSPGAAYPLKPEGELIELADAVIRIMDYCGFKNWDLEAAIRMKVEYNASRAHRHGGKAF